jgi:hypothetical protein
MTEHDYAAQEDAFFAEVHRITQEVHMTDQAPSFEAYHAALAPHAAHPVVFETCVLELTMLLAALQLSLRHPEFPASTRIVVEGFVADAIAQLDRLDPVLGQTLRAGNDSTQDGEV